MSFLSIRSMKVVLNSQSSEAHAINIGVTHGPLLGPTLFMIYINEASRGSIFISLVNIYIQMIPRFIGEPPKMLITRDCQMVSPLI